MQKFKTINDIIALAEFAHRNQTDRAGLPYIEHPRRVMDTVRAQGALPYVQMAAILHDVTEDTSFTPEILLDLGVPEAAVSVVALLDRDISYQAFLAENQARDVGGTINGKTWYLAYGPKGADEFYYSAIAANHDARMVKLADISDNLQPWRLAYLPVATQERLKAKYAEAKRLLGA